MPRPAPSVASLPHRFSQFVEGLRGAVAARCAVDRALAPLLMLLWSRLGGMARQFSSAAGRVGAPTRVPAAVRTPRGRPRPSPSRPPLSPCARMPRDFGWLLRLAPEAACHGGRLQHLLSDPAMVELLEATPGARRVLRSLCRMLAITPGPELASPAREERGRSRPEGGEDGAARDPAPRTPTPRVARKRRERVPRAVGFPWLRWRSADGTG